MVQAVRRRQCPLLFVVLGMRALSEFVSNFLVGGESNRPPLMLFRRGHRGLAVLCC